MPRFAQRKDERSDAQKRLFDRHPAKKKLAINGVEDLEKFKLQRFAVLTPFF